MEYLKRANMYEKVLFFVVLLVVTLAIGFPFYWMIVTSLQKKVLLFSFPPAFIPSSIGTLRKYLDVFRQHNIGTWLRNSLYVGLGSTLVCLCCSIPVAYSLSSFKYRGRKVIGFLVLTSQMLPSVLILIPLYLVFRDIGLLDKLESLILANVSFSLPLSIWVLKSIFDKVSMDIQDAAKLDGCGRLGILWRIVLPVSLPGLVVVSVFSFFVAWDEYLFATTFINSPDKWVGTIGLVSFIGEIITPWDEIMTVATIYAIPAVIFYLLTQRYMVSGLMGGAVKE